MSRSSIVYIGTLLILGIGSCSAPEFYPNKDNALLVGDWTIVEIDDADALLTTETFVLSVMEENYKVGRVFRFDAGDQFSLLEEDGAGVQKGSYGISNNDAKLQLKFSKGDYLLEYAMKKEGEALRLDARTDGEILNLILKKAE